MEKKTYTAFHAKHTSAQYVCKEFAVLATVKSEQVEKVEGGIFL